MKLAMVNGERREAEKGLVGICIGCEQPMIPKCGKKNIKHWAHKSKCECDRWWENETPWHRNWKNHFPKEWQEIRHQDERGTFHIADVKTDQGIIVELQNSVISKEERDSRNEFYKKMIWIVNGLRNKGDLGKFEKALSGLKPNHLPTDIHSIPVNSCIILQDWIDCSTPIFLDFGHEEKLWLIYPKIIDSNVFIKQVQRSSLIHNLKNGAAGAESFQRSLNEFENMLFPPRITPISANHLPRLANVRIPINQLAQLMGIGNSRSVKQYTRPYGNRRKRF